MLGVLRALEGPTRVKPHCLSCQLYEEDGYEALLYTERWDSESEFHRHVRSDLFRQLLEATELSRRAPEIQFHRISETRGIDLLEDLRVTVASATNHPKRNAKP